MIKIVKQMKKFILVFFISILLISCLDSDKNKIMQVLEVTDKIIIRATNKDNMYLVKSLSADELKSFKNDIHKFKINGHIDNTIKIRSLYQLILYKDNRIIGMLFVDSAKNSCFNVNLSNPKLDLIINTDFDFKGYFDKLIIDKNIDCNQTFHKGIDFSKTSLYDFVQILKLKKPCPNGQYRLTTNGQASKNWITDLDIEYLIGLMDSKDTTYCIVQVISSILPEETDYSTLGGQVMIIIDSYRYNNSYPSFLCSCAKNDEDRKREILKWWYNKNKNK